MTWAAIAAVTWVAITTAAISRSAIKHGIAAAPFTYSRGRTAVTAVAGIPARTFSVLVLFPALSIRFLAGFFICVRLKKRLA